MFSERTKAFINLFTNVAVSALGAIMAAGLSAGDTWAFVNQPYVLIGVFVASLGALRATVNDSPGDHPRP